MEGHVTTLGKANLPRATKGLCVVMYWVPLEEIRLYFSEKVKVIIVGL
jgi:hypothetical protein